MTPRQDADDRSDAIIAAALLIADTLGLHKLTIRRVADEVGVAPMTIYGTVRSKEDLIGMVVRRALDDFVPPDLAGDWQDNVVALMNEYRRIMLVHPSIPQILAVQRVSVDVIGLSTLLDSLLRELDRGGVDEGVMVSTMLNLIKFALGWVMFEIPRRDPVRVRPRHRDGLAGLAEVEELARIRSLTYLGRFATDVMAERRPDSYGDGVRNLVIGLPPRNAPDQSVLSASNGSS